MKCITVRIQIKNTVPVDPFAPWYWRTTDGILLNQRSDAPVAWKKTLTIPVLSRLFEIPESVTKNNNNKVIMDKKESTNDIKERVYTVLTTWGVHLAK